MYQTLKANIDLALKWKDQSIITMLTKGVQNSLKTKEITQDQHDELMQLIGSVEPVKTENIINQSEPKACFLDDPNCESCSS